MKTIILLLLIGLGWKGEASPDTEMSLENYCAGACTQESNPHYCKGELPKGLVSQSPLKTKGANRCDALTKLCKLAQQEKIPPEALTVECWPTANK